MQEIESFLSTPLDPNVVTVIVATVPFLLGIAAVVAIHALWTLR